MINDLEKAMQNPIIHMPNEADVGSGEKGPGQKETEKMIEQVGEKLDESNREEKDANASEKPAA